MPTRIKERAQEQARERFAKATVDIGRQLETKRAELAQGLAQMDKRHPAETRGLQLQQDRLLAGRDQREREQLDPLMRSQRERREQFQQTERDLVAQALEVAARVSSPKAALEELEHARKSLELLRRELARNVRDEQAEIREILSEKDRNRDSEPDLKRLDALARDQRDDAELRQRDIAVAKAELDHREVADRNRLDDQRLQRLRGATAQANLSDEAIQRLADEAVCPGRRELSLRNEPEREAAVQRTKGQLAEELARRLAQDMIAALKERDPSRNLEFIAGDRIRDEQRRKLTDGVIAWRDKENTLRVLMALEVKAGERAARELNATVQKLGRKGREELQRYARDLAREEIAARQATEKRSAREWDDELRAARDRHEAELRSPEAQREPGQVRRTEERLDLMERIYLDGQADRMTVDRGTRLDTLVQSVVPEDVKEGASRRLAIGSQQLDEMARRIVDELRRRQEEEEEEV